MGIDLGTSSLKTLIMDEQGNVKSLYSQEYPIEIPLEGSAEQNPDLWWEAAVNTIRRSLNTHGIKPNDVKCIGLSGQMHGMVILDKDNNVIRPAVIHCDQRSELQVERIYETAGRDEVSKITLNPVFPGFQIASLLWVKENEPDNYKRICKVILPKDFIRFKLTGKIATDSTDASATLAFDVSKRCWSESLISKLGLDNNIFPECMEPYDIAGYITSEAALQTGLKKDTPVVCGTSDQPAQALGNGIIRPGFLTSTIGTSGQIFTPVEMPLYNSALNTHTFCNVKPDTWYVMGAILSAGLSLRWLKDNILCDKEFRAIDEEASKIPVCSNGLIFLPYLAGERTPYLDTNARGVFFGLTMKHNINHMSRAIMEGVAFALKDCIGVIEQLGIGIEKVIASGGGAKSKLWLQIQADVFGREIYTTETVEQACTGSAILAGVGCGIFRNLEEATNAIVKVNESPTIPIEKNISLYEYHYNVYKDLYIKNKELFEKVGSNMKELKKN